MTDRTPLSTLFLLLLMFLFLPACGTMQKKPSLQEGRMSPAEMRGMALMSRLGAGNESMNTFKGLGRVTIEESHRKLSLRIAFAGVYPDRLRFSVMDVSGRVIETFACDGRSIYLMSHQGDHAFIHKKKDPKTLEKILSVPMLPEELIGLLTGRPWFGNYERAAVTELPNGNMRIDLVKKKSVWSALMLSSGENLQSITRYDKKSRALYQVILSRYKPYEGFYIPSLIDIRKNRATGIRLEIVKYWPNSGLAPGIFTLSEEKEAPLP
jgi:hypothetical protein